MAMLPSLQARMALSRAKHPSLAGHARIARQVAKLVPFYGYDEEQFFRSDQAPVEIAAQRRLGFMRLATLYHDRFRESVRLTAAVEGDISDLQFTNRYRVPFQYSRYLREHLRQGTFLKSSSGVTVTDLDGNSFYDLSGAYGVNVFGYDFYKACIDSSRYAHFERDSYRRWLKDLRAVCTERGIVLILDEVFVGFRLALGGAQEYFGVRADMVTCGKTIGGGMPIGVLCGRRDLMKRFREDRPSVAPRELEEIRACSLRWSVSKFDTLTIEHYFFNE
jgi:hypothetical protein